MTAMNEWHGLDDPATVVLVRLRLSVLLGGAAPKRNPQGQRAEDRRIAIPGLSRRPARGSPRGSSTGRTDVLDARARGGRIWTETELASTPSQYPACHWLRRSGHTKIVRPVSPSSTKSLLKRTLPSTRISRIRPLLTSRPVDQG